MKDWELWIMIPALMVFTLIFFVSFDNYTITEWLLGNGIVSLGIGCVYISEGVYKRCKK